MERLKCLLVLIFIFSTSCATVNNAGNKITTERKDQYLYKSIDGHRFRTSEGYNQKTSWPYYTVYCNNQLAYVIYNVNNQSYLRTVEYINKNYFVLIEKKLHSVNIDEILPEDVAIPKFDKIVFEKTGFKTLKEYNQHLEQQRQLEQERAKLEEERVKQEREEERIRLRNEIDNNFGVVAIGSLFHVKNSEVKIGEIIRLGDTFPYDFWDWSKSNTGGYLFGEFDEFEIRGLDMQQVKIKEIRPNYLGRFVSGGGMNPGGRRGYIVKYLGTEDVVTQAGLRKVIWVLECIGGNEYSD